MINKKVYIELSKAKIKDKRSLVVSRNETNGGYTIAQQLVVEEGRRSTTIFMKGAIYVEDLDGLYNLRDALNEAIKKEEDREHSNPKEI